MIQLTVFETKHESVQVHKESSSVFINT